MTAAVPISTLGRAEAVRELVRTADREKQLFAGALAAQCRPWPKADLHPRQF